jgi:4-hydroxy-tetrahydrodipicolinate synthase
MISSQSTTRARIRGVLAPVLTPFTSDLRPDTHRFVEHARWLTNSGAGLAIFGTNSEAASLTVEERIELTDALLAAGIPAGKMMPGTGNCALGDTVRLTTHAVRNGAAGVLMLPPFYYKGVSDDGLFAYFSEAIERVGDERLAVYLYHIPQVSGVPINIGLIERLLKRYPSTIAGAKDSSGNWHNTEQMIQLFAGDGFDVFPASEALLSQALAIGGAGCISATVNINPAAIHALYAAAANEREVLQARADAVRHIVQAMAMIPAMKFVLSEFTGHRSWSVVRPPLVALQVDEGQRLMKALLDAGFRMPGVPKAGKPSVVSAA